MNDEINIVGTTTVNPTTNRILKRNCMCNSLNTFRWILYCFCGSAEWRTPPGHSSIMLDMYLLIYNTRVSSCVSVELICNLKSNVYKCVGLELGPAENRTEVARVRFSCRSDEISIQTPSDFLIIHYWSLYRPGSICAFIVDFDSIRLSFSLQWKSQRHCCYVFYNIWIHIPVESCSFESVL